jgi:hypothetical protein
MGGCAIAPSDKRAIARRVGKHLASVYGPRKSYSPAIVRAAMRRCEFPADWDCWALSLYTAQTDFDAFHAALGEACDYAAMRAEMAGAIDPALSPGLPGFDWLDALPSLDLDAVDLPDANH